MKPMKKQSFLQGAGILAFATIAVKIIGALYKIPLNNIIGKTGMTYFTHAYDIYALLLIISTAGLPVAMSRMIAKAQEEGNPFAFMDVTPVFIDVGVLIHNVNDRLIGFLLDSLSFYACAAVRTELCAGGEFFSTVFAIHRIPLFYYVRLDTIPANSRNCASSII